MNKSAKTNNPVIDLIKDRWSPRSFSNKRISQEDMNTILEAASWAFSTSNVQPWNYTYAHREESGFQKLLDCLLPGNQAWAKNAAVIISVNMNPNHDNGKPNVTAMHDIGAANATMSLQALSMGIHSHVMGGFDAVKTTEILQLNTKLQTPVVFIALGYLDAPEKLEEPFRTRELGERKRKPINEISTLL